MTKEWIDSSVRGQGRRRVFDNWFLQQGKVSTVTSDERRVFPRAGDGDACFDGLADDAGGPPCMLACRSSAGLNLVSDHVPTSDLTARASSRFQDCGHCSRWGLWTVPVVDGNGSFPKAVWN